MDNKIITADGVNIDVDKHEDEKTKERDVYKRQGTISSCCF